MTRIIGVTGSRKEPTLAQRDAMWSRNEIERASEGETATVQGIDYVWMGHTLLTCLLLKTTVAGLILVPSILASLPLSGCPKILPAF